MKKTFKIVFFVILVLIAITMLSKPKTLVAEAPTLSEREEVLEKQKEDPLFNKIGICESKDDPVAKNPYSSAKGRFQFLDGTWKWYAPKLWGDDWVNKNVLSYQDNTDLAWFVYTNFGTGDWEADPKSYECWKSEIPNGIYKNIY